MKHMLIFLLIALLSGCIQEPQPVVNSANFIYIAKNTFANDFGGGLEIHGGQQWNGNLQDATHIVFDIIDMLGTTFPDEDEILVRGFSVSGSFEYRLEKEPTNDYYQYMITSVTMSTTTGNFVYGNRWSVRVVY